MTVHVSQTWLFLLAIYLHFHVLPSLSLKKDPILGGYKENHI